jgi:putative ABC transport system substrate-binding protein
MTTRRTLLISLGAAALTGSWSSFGQSSGKARIGFLGLGSAAAYAPRIDAFRKELREFGYVEGKNLSIEYRWADGNYERLRQFAAELVRLNVDVIVTHTTPATQALRNASTSIPIVVTDMAGDPVEGGLVNNLARPGGNITGTTYFGSELGTKRLELLKEATPHLKRLGWLVNSNNPVVKPLRKAMDTAAKALKVDLREFDVHQRGDFDAAFLAMSKAHIDAVLIMEDPLFTSNIKAVAELANSRHMPSAGYGGFAVAGGMIGYGINFQEQYRRAAYFVDKILSGTKPADLPFERPTKFELVINLQSASTLGVTIPKSILVRADRVVE